MEVDKNLMALAYLQSLKRESTHIRDKLSGIDTYVFIKDDYQIVNFFYSSEGIDWKTNFNFWFKKWKRPDYARSDSKIRVHTGYFDGWMRIRDKVLGMITSDKIIVTGFSMGGGVSSIAAVDIDYNKNPIEIHCFDFDGAKVWNKAGRDSFAKRISNGFKIKNGNDLVTKVPPFYYHAGTKIHIGAKEYWWKFSVQDHRQMIDEPATILAKLLGVE